MLPQHPHHCPDPNRDRSGNGNKAVEDTWRAHRAGAGYHTEREEASLFASLFQFFDSHRERETRQRRCEQIACDVANLPGVSTGMFTPGIANAGAHLRIRRDCRGAQLTPEHAPEELRKDGPAIEVRPSFSEGLEVPGWMLAAGEDHVVEPRVRSVLAAAPRRAARRWPVAPFLAGASRAGRSAPRTAPRAHGPAKTPCRLGRAESSGPNTRPRPSRARPRC